MAKTGPDNASGRPLDELVQSVSEQAAEVARQEVDIARRELTAKAKQAATGVAMVGGGAFLGALAASTGTAALVLLLSRQARPSAAALGVSAMYAAGGAALAQEGISRLRGAAPPVPEATVRSVKQGLGAKKAKRGKAPVSRRGA
jgi:Putative Actinobacterial Holin-X, holin superfamily III